MKITFLFVVLPVLLTNIKSATQAQLLDQSNIAPNNNGTLAIGNNQLLAQTFTVGLKGTLSRIDVQVSKNTGTAGEITFLILPTVNGLPVDDLSLALVKRVLPVSVFPTSDNILNGYPLTSIDIQDAEIMVVPDEELAVFLSSSESANAPPWVEWRTNINAYSRGQGFFKRSSTMWEPITLSSTDYGFQTYVSPESSVPEPSIYALLLSLFLMITFFIRDQVYRHLASWSSVIKAIRVR